MERENEKWADIFKSKKFWAALVASLVLKEIITKISGLTASGAVSLWSKVLYVVTLNSAQLRNVPYASAALDPSALQTTVLLAGAGSAAIAYVVFNVYRVWSITYELWIDSKRRYSTGAEGAKKDGGDGPVMPRRLVVALAAHSAISIIMIFAVATPVALTSKAVSCRRIYDANRDIVAPFLDRQQTLELQSRFAMVETKEQYHEVMGQIADVAKQHGVKVHPLDDPSAFWGLK